MIGSRRLAAGTLLALLGTLSAPDAARAQRTTSPGSFALELAGAPVGILRGASGGEAVGEVVTEATGGAFAGKRIGAVRFSDIELEIGAGMEPAVYAWIASAWEEVEPDVQGRPAGELQPPGDPPAGIPRRAHCRDPAPRARRREQGTGVPEVRLAAEG